MEYKYAICLCHCGRVKVDIIITDKKEKSSISWIFMSSQLIAVPADGRVYEKEREKVEKFKDLGMEIRGP